MVCCAGTLVSPTSRVLFCAQFTLYIGAGHGAGNGNPYGLAAAVAVFLGPVVFLRLYLPPQYLPAALLFGVSGVLQYVLPALIDYCQATFVLIVGYSWVNGHLVIVGNVGIGWAVAWRRWVLVMIGKCSSLSILVILNSVVQVVLLPLR